MTGPSLAFRAALSLVLFVGFYVLGLGIAALLVFFASFMLKTKSAVGLKLAWASFAAAGVLLYSLRPRRDKFTAPGPEVTEHEQPALFRAIKEVSAAAGQPLPHDVFIVADVNAWVADRGGVMGVGGERVMTLGLGLMQLLSVGELKAVIAHELGHFSGGDTRLGRVVYRTHIALARTLEETSGRFVEWPFRLYGALFMRTSMGVSRSQEFAADAFAARLTDPRLLATGLEKVERHAIAFHLYRQIALGEVLHAGFRPPLAAGFQRFLSHPIAEAFSKMEQSAEKSAYDSHPPTPERVAALSAMPPSGHALDTSPAIALVRDLPALEAQVLAVEGVEAGKLTEISWSDVTSRVSVPAWRAMVAPFADVLRSINVATLPGTKAELVALARRMDSTRMKLTEDDDVASLMVGVIASAVALRLFDEGWTVADTALLQFSRGAHTLNPFELISQVLGGDGEARARWNELRRATGLGGAVVQSQSEQST